MSTKRIDIPGPGHTIVITTNRAARTGDHDRYSYDLIDAAGQVIVSDVARTATDAEACAWADLETLAEIAVQAAADAAAAADDAHRAALDAAYAEGYAAGQQAETATAS